MTWLLVLLHVVAEAAGHGATCWPELHPGPWIEWLCRL